MIFVALLVDSRRCLYARFYFCVLVYSPFLIYLKILFLVKTLYLDLHLMKKKALPETTELQKVFSIT